VFPVTVGLEFEPTAIPEYPLMLIMLFVTTAFDSMSCIPYFPFWVIVLPVIVGDAFVTLIPYV
jgi:hypothetical protein